MAERLTRYGNESGKSPTGPQPNEGWLLTVLLQNVRRIEICDFPQSPIVMYVPYVDYERPVWARGGWGILDVRGQEFSGLDPRSGRPHFSNFGPPAERSSGAHAALAHLHWVRETSRSSRRGPRLGRGVPIRPEHLLPSAAQAIPGAPNWFSSERRIDTRLGSSPCGDGPY